MISNNLPARTPRNWTLEKALAWIVVISLAALVWWGQDLIDWYAGTPRGEELLFCAARNGTADDIDRALSQGADINARGTADLTPLIVAAGARNPESVRALLDRHADPNLVACAGLTALYNAVLADDPEVIEMLIAAGVDPNKPTNQESALETAVRLDKPEAARCLRGLTHTAPR